MKTLSIKQPWADLIAIGLKDIENRSWRTNFRGKILIHASQRKAIVYPEILPVESILMAEILSRKEITSAIIGTVEIVDCIKNSSSVWAEPGQWHWVLKNAVKFEKPILNVKGKLSFWDFKIHESHVEIIECPECNKQQEAIVEHTTPFYSYVHTCEKCKYVIMESEWNKIDHDKAI